jgi:hypothetical protein
MKCVWLVHECGLTVAVCDTETTADKIIKHYPRKDLKTRKVTIIADVIDNKFYYYHQ